MVKQIPKEILREVTEIFLLGEERRYVCCQPPKKKLYVKLKEDGHTVLGHCFHCGTNFMSRLKEKKIGRKIKVSTKRYSLPPSDLIHTVKDWPALTRLWISNSGVTEEELRLHGIGYSPSRDTIIFPVSGGWQERFLSGPLKYLSYGKNDLYFHLENGLVCVIVEDVLSAIRIGRHTSAHALLGVSIKDCAPLIRYDRFVIWLDNDNAQVLAAVKKIEKRLCQWATVTVISAVADPKKQTEEELWQNIKQAM